MSFYYFKKIYFFKKKNKKKIDDEKTCNYEFDIGSNVKKNDFSSSDDLKETLSHFREIKDRKELIDNNFSPNSNVIKRIKAAIESKKNTQNEINVPVLEQLKKNRRILSIGKGVINNDIKSAAFCFPNSVSPLKNLVSKSIHSALLLASSPNNERESKEKKKKIIYSPKNKKCLINNFSEALENSNNTSPTSKFTLQKPLTIQKENKKLIFFKNKIIQIDDGKSLSLETEKERTKRKSDLFLNIIKSGNFPTKYMFNCKK